MIKSNSPWAHFLWLLISFLELFFLSLYSSERVIEIMTSLGLDLGIALANEWWTDFWVLYMFRAIWKELGLEDQKAFFSSSFNQEVHFLVWTSIFSYVKLKTWISAWVHKMANKISKEFQYLIFTTSWIHLLLWLQRKGQCLGHSD